VLVAVVSANLGSVFAVFAFELVGPEAVVALRSTFAVPLLLLFARPSLRGHSRQAWAVVIAFGLSLAAMNSMFSQSIARMPIGPAVTIEMLGPLVLSVILARRLSGWLWAVLALAGVVVMQGLVTGHGLLFDPLGVLFACGAAVAWAFYILLSRQAGKMFKSVDALVLAAMVAAVLTLPVGVAVEAASMFHWQVLGLGVLVALFSNAICNGTELIALRQVPAHVFSVMMALGPVAGSLLAFVLAHQRLGLTTLVGIGLVVVATMGATIGEGRRQEAA